MTDEEIFKRGLELSGREHWKSKYVYLRKDEVGLYIEYAFIDGIPHDNRCLSKYVTGYDNFKGLEVNKLYTLSSFTCGGEEGQGECKVGCPSPDCTYCHDWTYSNPKKCACWDLKKVDRLILSLDIAEIKILSREIENDNWNNWKGSVWERHSM